MWTYIVNALRPDTKNPYQLWMQNVLLPKHKLFKSHFFCKISFLYTYFFGAGIMVLHGTSYLCVMKRSYIGYNQIHYMKIIYIPNIPRLRLHVFHWGLQPSFFPHRFWLSVYCHTVIHDHTVKSGNSKSGPASDVLDILGSNYDIQNKNIFLLDIKICKEL